MKTKSLIQTTARDLGLAIANHIERQPCQHFDEAGNETKWSARIEMVHATDPDNLFVHMSNGECFCVSISPAKG